MVGFWSYFYDRSQNMLIDNLTTKWSPDKYTDEYQTNLAQIIEAKLKGKALHLKPERADTKQANVLDLMSRLRQSLQGGKRSSRRKEGQKHKVKHRIA